MAQSSKIEKKRFLDYFKAYSEASPEQSAQAAAQAQGAVAPKISNSAKAQKTIETRKGIHGSKTMTDAGVQSIKKSGKQKTQSQPKA